MKVQSILDAFRPLEEKVGGYLKSSYAKFGEFKHIDFAIPSTQISFRLESMVIPDVRRGGEKTSEQTPLQHDEVDLNPIEDIDILRKITRDQNTGYCDKALEDCLSYSMIPEEFVEDLLCKADKTLCTCQTTDGMEKMTGYNFCVGGKVGIVGDDVSKGGNGSENNSALESDGSMSIESGSEPNPLLNSMMETKESEAYARDSNRKNYISPFKSECEGNEEAFEREEDADESGFECVLRHEVPQAVKKEEESAIKLSNINFSKLLKDPSTEKAIKSSRKSRHRKQSGKMPFYRNASTDIRYRAVRFFLPHKMNYELLNT